MACDDRCHLGPHSQKQRSVDGAPSPQLGRQRPKWYPVIPLDSATSILPTDGTCYAGFSRREKLLPAGAHSPGMGHLLLIVMVGLAVGGCALGTNHVVLPATLAQEMPPTGDLLAVRVKDSRTDLSGAQVGFKRNGWGAKTGSVELADNESLARRLGRDLVAMSRARGFRASMGERAPQAPADVILDADISGFLVDAKIGWTITLESLAVVKVAIVDARAQQPLWSDVVRVDGRKPDVYVVVGSDYQQMVEDLYARLVSALRAAIPPVVPR